MIRWTGIAWFCLLWIAACTNEEETSIPNPNDDRYTLVVPPGFPEPTIPVDNALTKTRIALGRKLFYDPVLSLDSSRSCGSCHAAHLAFSDSTMVSLGIEQRKGTRNTPTLANVVYQQKLLREGGVPTLEMQILVPIQEHNEFDFNIVLAANRLNQNPAYVDLAMRAYNRIPDAFVITRSIAAFERSFISGNSPFDKWHFQGIQNAVSEEVQRGYALFQSPRLNCSSCHSGFLFTNQSFANNGLYEVYPDSGRFRLTGLESDRAVFKVPSLRNIALTAPYMHDGSLPTLNAVLNHYQTGGKNHPNKSPLLKKFVLTTQERSDLIAFLNSLTDRYFINDPQYRKEK